MSDLKIDSLACPVCGGQFVNYMEQWLLRCKDCGFWKSLLCDEGQGLSEESLVIEPHRQSGLRAVREVNNETILDILARFTALAGKRVLDVGCAYGWFLQAAGRRGMIPVGIEPEETVSDAARLKGCRVLGGYFPDCVDQTESCFDVIAFNDVLEHLPAPEVALAACASLLTQNGKLVVGIPVSTGIFYRLSLILARFGYRKPLYRLWQKEYRSPHTVYFNARNFAALADRFGFSLICRHPLQTLTLKGLWSRLKMDRELPTLMLVLLYVCLLFLSPLLKVLTPADIELFIFELRTQGGHDGVVRNQQTG